MKNHGETALTETHLTTELINTSRATSAPDFCAAVREIILIASSSRGGSSVFSEILRHSRELLHFKGEINPFLVLAGLTFPHSGRADDSLDAADAGPQNAGKLARLTKEMALDVGIGGDMDLNEDLNLSRFMHDLHWRLSVQWPEIAIDQGFLFERIRATLAELCRDHGWSRGGFADPQLFHVLLLKKLRSEYPAINPYYYDLRPDLIERFCPETERNYDCPSSCIIEEPPFIPIVPRQTADREMATNMPLILKTPSNVYRLPFLKKVFPNARFRILHLVRNPADSINGLVDGWLYHGFFSHQIKKGLNIKGYSDRFPVWGKKWWKYDLPPGWEEFVDQPLEFVCGHQWNSAHRQILTCQEENRDDYLRVRFEDVIGPVEIRRRVFAGIIDWLGIEGREIMTAATVDDLPPIMTTTTLPPRQRRWFKKIAIIRPVLTDPKLGIRSIARELGYSLNEELKG